MRVNQQLSQMNWIRINYLLQQYVNSKLLPPYSAQAICIKETHIRLRYIDYTLVFNIFIPIKIITKLQDLGLCASVCNWILSGRPKSERISNNISSLTISKGALQGSVLSFLLCSLYAHDRAAKHNSKAFCCWPKQEVRVQEIEDLHEWCRNTFHSTSTKPRDLSLTSVKGSQEAVSQFSLEGLDRVNSFLAHRCNHEEDAAAPLISRMFKEIWHITEYYISG